jgi:hypothetical protein
MCLLAVPAQAINSYNAESAPERTEVGALIVTWDRDGDGEVERLSVTCSGTMVDADTFLTAAHCVTDFSPDPADDTFYVTLEEDAQAPIDASGLDRTEQGPELADWLVDHDYAVEADVAYDPGYPHDQADRHDIAVAEFADRAEGPADLWTFTPATLPTRGLLDEIGPRGLEQLRWTVVGYGTQEAQRGPGGQVFPAGNVRLKARVGFDALNKTWIREAMREPQGWGGACYGDSGGPNFVRVDGERILAGITITGDTPCYATNVAYRVDTRSARSFLRPYVALP